jgi:hypothetical protein
MNPVITNNLSKIQEVCKKYKVKELYAFGSVTENDFNEKSDVDLLVEFDKSKIPLEDFADNFFDLADNLENIFNRRVDLLTLNSLKNPYFIQEVNKSKQIIYAA